LERTRGSLISIQERIANELRGRLGAAANQAISSLSEVVDDNQILPLRNDLAAARNETERTCDEMVHWFQGSDAMLLADPDLGLVARTAIGMIEKLNPDYRGRHNLEIKHNPKIRGRFFTALVHIVFFLLENALRHSDITKDRFHSALQVCGIANLLEVQLRSRMASSERATLAVNRINDKLKECKAALDPAKVVREGGSGFAKIITTVRYEFKQGDPEVIASAQGEFLTVSVSCALAGLEV
jgi:hypothetical protein